jgi:hypothetical protein
MSMSVLWAHGVLLPRRPFTHEACAAGSTTLVEPVLLPPLLLMLVLEGA